MFLRFWFWLCSSLGRGVGSVLAAPFFVSLVPPCWSLRCGRWVRRWPPASCGRPSFSSGWRGRWVCVPAASVSLAALRRLPLSSPLFPWAVAPAVVVRWGRFRGVVFSVWLFVADDEDEDITERCDFNDTTTARSIEIGAIPRAIGARGRAPRRAVVSDLSATVTSDSSLQTVGGDHVADLRRYGDKAISSCAVMARVCARSPLYGIRAGAFVAFRFVRILPLTSSPLSATMNLRRSVSNTLQGLPIPQRPIIRG